MQDRLAALETFSSEAKASIDRVTALEAFSRDAKAFFDHAADQVPARDLEARISAVERKTQDTDLEARIAAVEARRIGGKDCPVIARQLSMESGQTSAESRILTLEARSTALEARSAKAPSKPKEDAANAASLAATNAQFMRSMQSVEGDILTLQGELVTLQTRTQMQGVSSSIFSLRAVDMDTRSRAKSLDILAKREGEVKRLMDVARQAKERGGMAELLTQLGVRVAKSAATGDPQVQNFSLGEESNGRSTFNLMPSETAAEREAPPRGGPSPLGDKAPRGGKRAESVGRV